MEATGFQVKSLRCDKSKSPPLSETWRLHWSVRWYKLPLTSAAVGCADPREPARGPSRAVAATAAAVVAPKVPVLDYVTLSVDCSIRRLILAATGTSRTGTGWRDKLARRAQRRRRKACWHVVVAAEKIVEVKPSWLLKAAAAAAATPTIAGHTGAKDFTS